MEVMFYMMFFLVMSFFIVTFARMIGEWIRNSNSPRLTADATVVAKRDQMHRHTSSNGHSHRSYSYHVTFQFASGDRVAHAIFGKGTVASVRAMGGDALIEVEFDGGVKKKLMQNFAKLEKI